MLALATARFLLLHVFAACLITLHDKQTEALIAGRSNTRPISTSNVTTLSPRRYLWEASDTVVDYDAEVLVNAGSFDVDIGSESRAEEREQLPASTTRVTTERQAESGKALEFDWLAAFRACDNGSAWASEETQVLIDMLSCTESKRTLPLECSLVSPDNVQCVCSTLYGVRTSDSSGSYVFDSFALNARDATVENVLVGAKRCLPDWMTLDVVLQYNTSLAVRHDVTVVDEANWLTVLARSWIAENRITTFDIPPGNSFQHVDALMLNASECANHAWFARWQLQLRVHSALFEIDLGLLLHFVRTSMPAFSMHNYEYKLLRICVLAEPGQRSANYDSDSDDPNADPDSIYGLYSTLYCPEIQLNQVAQTSDFDSTSFCLESVDPDDDVTIADDEDALVTPPNTFSLTTDDATVFEEEPADDLEAVKSVYEAESSTIARESTNSAVKYTVAVAADANVAKLSSDAALDAFRLPSALPSWLLATIILASSFGFGSLSALVTCYLLRQRRKNKGSYKIRLFNPKMQNDSLPRSAVSFKVPLTAPATIGVNTFVSLDEPLVHDYSSGPPPREFFA